MTTTLSEVENWAKHPEQLEFKHQENAKTFQNSLRKEKDSKTGGTYDGLFKPPNMNRFQRARKKLSKEKWNRQIETQLGQVNKRLRRMSEHDGDWDHSRQWDTKPFSSTKRLMAPIRVLRLDCHFGIAWHAKASAIDRYGAQTWAISDILESLGFQTEINFIVDVRQCTRNEDFDAYITTIVKKPGQYLSPGQLARVFSANFFRRIGFGLIARGADLCGERVDPGLGRPRHNISSGITFQDGALAIRPNTMNGLTDKDHQEILKAIGARR